MKIPFSLPVIDDEVIAEMHDTLTHTGWLTTGPKPGLWKMKSVSSQEVKLFCV